MKLPFALVKQFFLDLIEKHPSLGYIGATASGGTGFWVLLEKLTALGAFLSIMVGVAVGIVTLYVQFKHALRLHSGTKTTDKSDS